MPHDAPVCVAAMLVELVRLDAIPQRCIRTGQAVRQRKFPGPAGLLPDKVGGALVSVIKQLRSLLPAM